MSVAGSLVPGADAGVRLFDPSKHSFRLVVGPWSHPVVRDIPAGDGGWTVKGQVLTWKARRDSLKVRIDLANLTFKASLDGPVTGAPSTEPVAVALSLGGSSAADVGAWTPAGPRGRDLTRP
jgi:hypothetical protein